MHIDIVACGLECAVPRKPRTRYWPALEDGDDFEGNQIGYIEADENPDGDLDLAFGENLEVEQEDGDLRDGEDGQIDELVPEV